jgi:hypothetical protein
MLLDAGVCNKERLPHVKCSNPSWKYLFKLSFQQEPTTPDHGTDSSPYSFESWFHSWDQTGDPDIKRLCEISWNASRAALRLESK